MRDVRFYRQSLDFTCGPASLLMAMGALDPARDLSRREEIDIWREATVAGVPATSHYGLALAAHRRGFPVRIVATTDDVPFRKRVEQRMPYFYADGALDVLWSDIRDRAREAGIPDERRAFTLEDVDAALDAGEVPIVLTDTIHFGEDEHIPHWVVVARAESGGYHVYNSLDEGPDHVLVAHEAMRGALGFDGESMAVVVQPRDR